MGIAAVGHGEQKSTDVYTHHGVAGRNGFSPGQVVLLALLRLAVPGHVVQGQARPLRQLRHHLARRRDCHYSAAPPSTFSRCFNTVWRESVSEMAVSAAAGTTPPGLRLSAGDVSKTSEW